MHTHSRRLILLRSLVVFVILCGTVVNAQAQLIDPFVIDEELVDIAFRNEFEGYALAPGFVWRTSDAGATWTRTLPLGFRPPFTTIALFGESGLIIGDENGGIHWASHPDSEWSSMPGDGHYVVEIEVIDGDRWVAITDSLILSTRDGGKTFSRFAPNGRRWRPSALDITNESLMHICDYYSGTIWRSTDGGSSWDSLHIMQFGELYDVQFISADTGFVASWYPWNLFTTVDGGETWRSGPFEYPTSIAVRRDGLSAYATPDYVRLSLDGGMTWPDSVSFPSRSDIFQYETQRVVAAGPNSIFVLNSNSDPAHSIVARVDITSDVQREERSLPEKFDLSSRE